MLGWFIKRLYCFLRSRPAFSIHRIFLRFTTIAITLLILTQLNGQDIVHPKPEPAKAFSELKIYNSDSQPFRFPIEDWKRARQRAVNDSAWQVWVAQQRAEVDDWMAHRTDRVQWIAGWWHDFVSPKDGSFLIWTPDEPGAETLSSPSDPKVTLTPKLKNAWVYGFRSRHGTKILEAARLCRLTNEKKYGRWAVDQLEFYAENFDRWPVQYRGTGIWKSRSRLFHQPLDEAVNLIRHINAVRLLDDFVTPRQKRKWYDQLFSPQAQLLNESFQSIHNIACWQRAAMGCVAMQYEDDALWHKAVDAPFGIRQQMLKGVTSDYFWFEQSMGYNSYVAKALLPFFEFAALTGRAGQLENEFCILENLMLAPTAIRFPTGQLPNPADSTGGPSHAPDRRLLASAYRLFPTTIGLNQAEKTQSWDTLLDPPWRSSAHPHILDVISQNLQSSRMAVIRHGPWQVFFHYGQLHSSHAQREALNFEAFYGNTDITHDPGTVGYGSPLHRGFYKCGPAHNVPLFNGRGQERWDKGELLRFDANANIVAARQRNYRSDASAERVLRIQGNRLIDEVTLTMKNNQSARLGLALHLQGTLDLPETFRLDTEFTTKYPGTAFKYWKKPRSAPATNSIRMRVRFGQQVLMLTLQMPREFRVTHASTPDVAPRRRESLYFEQVGTSARFTTILEPDH